MRPRDVRPPSAWLAGACFLILIVLTGCVRVEVVDSTTAAGTPDVSAGSASKLSGGSNLALLAVDFDPPLNYQQLILRQRSAALVVAIENTGSLVQQDVTVRAELSTSENPEVLLSQGASLASIEPGETQIVRFAHLGDIPYYATYHLEVVVDPVDGEIDIADNRKAFDIQIYEEKSQP